MKNKVIIFAVHPDDETLGAGGSLLKHTDNDDEVHWVILTQMFKENGFSPEAIDKRQKEIHAVSAAYKFSSLTILPFATTKLDQYPTGDLVKEISNVVLKIQPEIIYIPFKNDVHTDHKISYQALASLTKTFRYPFIRKILSMEVLSETNFGLHDSREAFFPNYYVDITKYFNKKIEILKIYSSELGEHPFPRSLKSVEALSVLRGSEVNTNYAEAFQLIKAVD